MNEEELIKKRMMEQQQLREQQKQLESQLEANTRKFLTDEARTRLTNIKLVDYEKYLKVSQLIMYAVQNNQIKGKIGEEELKALLMRISQKKEMKIRRK